MSSLSAFMSENALKVDVIEVVVSNRFLGPDKEPMKWKIGPVNGAEDKQIRKICTKQVPVPGKRNQYRQEFDANEYLSRQAAACVIFPDLKDAVLQDSYGVKTPHDLLDMMLTTGEFSVLSEKVQEINNATTLTEDVEEAKN